jgi:hypothetical protein
MAQRRSTNRVDAGEGTENGKRRNGITYRAPLRVLVVFVAAAIGAWLGPAFGPGRTHAFTRRAQRATRNNRSFEGRRGPWGQLHYSRIAISMPDEYIPDLPPGEPIRWWFEGFTRERLESLFRDAGLTPEQLGSLDQAAWETSSEGVIVDPPRQLVAGLSPMSRGRIYEALAGSSLNEEQRFPEVLDPEDVEERFEASGLGAPTLGMFRKLLYPRGSRLLFSDTQIVFPTLESSQARRRFLQMAHRKMTFLVQLVIDETSDIDAMVAYWDNAGRFKETRTLFEALARAPGGGELDISLLLPPFARERLYTFPAPSTDPSTPRRDCLWTSLNFFNDQPDDRFSEPEYTQKVLEQDYEKVESPRFGDIALFLAPSKQSVHAAVYLADDLVFTKNGFAATQPWIIMTLSDIVDFYSIGVPNNLELQYFRRKG